MSEAIVSDDLEASASQLRESEARNRIIGCIAVGATACWGVLIATGLSDHLQYEPAIPILSGLEFASLYTATYAVLHSVSFGRKADVIDAEILRRQTLVENPE